MLHSLHTEDINQGLMADSNSILAWVTCVKCWVYTSCF